MSELDNILRPFSDYGYHHEDGCRADCKNCKMLDEAKAKLQAHYARQQERAVLEALVSEHKTLWSNVPDIESEWAAQRLNTLTNQLKELESKESEG